MPPVSEKQRRAMYAAAEGHSNLGIPKSVGGEFVGKDAEESPQLAAGVIFIAPDGGVLLLCRSAQEPNYGGHWALPGGKGEPGEMPWEIACREAEEEIGSANKHAWIGEPTIADEVTTPTGMVFTTFVQPVRYRFTPELDAEHSG
ncbi:MAG: NUDIX hydrolase, partial [Rhizomicrobium sp.]